MQLLNEIIKILNGTECDFIKVGKMQLLVSEYEDIFCGENKMDVYERIYNAAMDDTDPYLVNLAMKIGQDDSLTLEQKTDAIWNLFQIRRKKKAEEKAKKLSSGNLDVRTDRDVLSTK